MTQLLVLLLLLLATAQHRAAACPMERCDPSLSGFSNAGGAMCPSAAIILWQQNQPQSATADADADAASKGNGCVANGFHSVCSSLLNGTFVALDAMNGGAIAWAIPDLTSSADTLPLLDFTGGAIAWDTSFVGRVDGDGISQWSIPLLPKPASNVFSPILADNTLITLLGQDGAITAIYGDGLPYGRITLNTTFSSQTGAFQPVGMASSVGTAVYLITKFVPASAAKPKADAAASDAGRLYALDISPDQGQRIKISWFVDIKLHASLSPDLFVPFVSQNGNIALVTAPGVLQEGSVADILVVEDNGDSGRVLFRQPIRKTDTLGGVAFNDIVLDKPGLGGVANSPHADPNNSTGLWISFKDSPALLRVELDGGNDVQTVDLSKVSPLLQAAVPSSRMLALAVNTTSQTDFALIFGVSSTRSTNETLSLVAVELSTVFSPTRIAVNSTLLWSADLPPNTVIYGQIAAAAPSAMDMSSGTVLVASTNNGIFGFGNAGGD